MERDDFAQGTSSRSSKMVHGGLRYLQNFDLGLVREALLERQLLVQLAPHLVYPTPVPGAGARREPPRPPHRDRPEHVRRDGDLADRPRSRASAPSTRDEAEYWSPDRHRTIAGEEAAELIPALGPLEPSSAYLFYDCQTDDVRLVLTVLGEAERFGAVVLNGAEVTEVLDDGRQRRRGCASARPSPASASRCAPTTSSTRPGSGPTGSGRTSSSTEEEIPRIAPSRGTHITLSTEDLDIGSAACIVPAGGGPDDLRAALVRAGARRDHRQRLRRRTSTTVPPSGDDVDYLLEAVNDYFGLEHRPR